MPSPIQRDPAQTARALDAWLTRRFPDAGEIHVDAVHAPPSSGFSGETLLLDTTWAGSSRPLVVRVAPTTYTVFLEPDFEAQYRVMAILSRRTEVPMPEMLAFEPDTEVLGAPFSLMVRVEGEAAADSPPYTESGFIKEASPQQQAALYDSGLRAMAAVHRVDWRALGLDFLQRDEHDYLERYYAWAAAQLPVEVPTMEAALEWVRANRPAEPEDPALCWGDARPGNQLYRDFQVAAVLDWEMVTIGDPIMDLGWWLFLERFHTDGSGQPPLPGFPGADAAVARWSELTGRSVDPEVLRFYVVFAGVRFGVVMMRLATLFAEFGLMPDPGPMARANPVLVVLADELGLPAPTP